MQRRDNEHWRRPEDIPKIRNLKRDRLTGPIFKPPADAPKSVNCKHCETDFPVPWSEELPFEYSTIQSADGDFWVPVGFPIKCPECGSENQFEIETTVFCGYLKYFADEAFRDNIKGWFPFCYSLVAVYPEYVDDIKLEFNNIKRDFHPYVDPNSWVIHVKELRNDKKRKKLFIRDVSIDESMEFIRNIAAWIGNNNEKFSLCSFFSISKIEHGRGTYYKDIRMFQTACRDLLFQSIYMILTDQTTKSGFSPAYTFESDTNIIQRPFVQEWIERISRGHKYSLLHHYISRGHDITLPTSAAKGDDFRLEIADILAFSTMHNIQRWIIEREPVVSMNSFGPILYGAYSGRRFGVKTETGVPWTFFFGDQKI